MGRKGNWLNAMKKALHPESKEKSTQERGKSKKKWFRKKKRSSDPKSPKVAETAPTTTPTPTPSSPAAPPASVAPQEPTKSNEVEKEQPKHTAKATPVAPPEAAKSSETTGKKEQTKHAYNVAVATAKAAEAAITAAQAAAEVVRLTAAASRFAGKTEEEIAAIKIQAAFRGYMGKRTLRALQGLMRLKTTMQGQAVKRQTTNTLKCMQTLARVQSQVRERRLKTAEENQARKREIQQNYEKDQPKVLEKSEQNGDGWDSSGKTKDQIEANLQIKHEAAIRRERTLAYAYTHQQPWKPTPRPASTMFMDSNTPHWGWSWLERWLAARPWETAIIPDNVLSNENSPRVLSKSSPSIGSPRNEMTTKSSSHNHITDQKPSPTSIPKQQNRSPNGRLSTSSAPSSKHFSTARKVRSPSPRASPKVSPKVSPKASPQGSTWGPDDDAKSMLSSVQSEYSRRNSVDGSYVGDDEESLTGSRMVPSFMAPTQSAKAKTRVGSEAKRDNKGVMTPDRVSVSSTKKRHSYSPSPAKSRPSTSSIPDANSISDQHT